MNVGPCASTRQFAARDPRRHLGRAQGGREGQVAAGQRLADAHHVRADAGVPGREQRPRSGRTRWRSHRRSAARRRRRTPRGAPAGSRGRGSACRPRPARPVPRSPRRARRACRSISAPARRVRLVDPGANPAGGGPANTCAGSTPSHIRCMPPSGSHTDMARNVSPWYPPRQVSSRVFAGRPARAPVLQAHLDRDLDDDRTRIAQEGVLEPVGGQRDQPVGQRDGGLVRQPAEHHVAHPAQLVPGGGVQRGVPVAVDRRPPRAHPVDELAAVGEPQPHAGRRLDRQAAARAPASARTGATPAVGPAL